MPQINDGAPVEASNVPLETVFDADEIDDPFSTAADKAIEKEDVCERL